MNIIDALKSGKRFKRKTAHDWYAATQTVDNRVFTCHEITADDWKIEREPREYFLTRNKDGMIEASQSFGLPCDFVCKVREVFD